MAVVFDFAELCAGRRRRLPRPLRGTLVCDDYVAYKALFRQGMMEASCMAHARRRFPQLYASHQSQSAEEALKLFGVLYDVELQVQKLDIDAKRATRQQLGKPAADTLHAWMLVQRQRVPDGSATTKAID
jgi:hypothetical protein